MQEKFNALNALLCNVTLPFIYIINNKVDRIIYNATENL